VVALLDISGSMSQYTRLFLHFLHAVTDARKRVHTFLFGTRLTNVSRALKEKDPDEALAACSASVLDWSGGTRIATSLAAFNKQWSRRVLTQGAVVLLFTDGLERDLDPGSSCSRQALQRLRGWFGATTFEPCDNRLSSLHAFGQAFLREAGIGSRLNDRTGELKLRHQFLVCLPVSGVFHPFAVKILNFAHSALPLHVATQVQFPQQVFFESS